MSKDKLPALMFKGFGGIKVEEPFVTTAENKKNTQTVIDEWSLGPLVPSIEPGANGPFWSKLAKAWQVSDKEARRRFCANCEYFQNDTMTQAKMERIPLNKYDTGAGGRGFCEKFDFICHNLRVCKAWEEREED
ncbi:MAG: hypothetical protein EBW87_01860 [Burkholderiaceae bacterium]|jgi:hypothetical protein|nr:hypothetical protein [Burkholderiaceae bacterium]